MMEASRGEQIRLELARMGYVRDLDGKYLIQVPLRKLEKKELEKLFYDGLKWRRYPGISFDSVMEELRRTEQAALMEKLSGLNVCSEELEEIARITVPVREHLCQIYRGDIRVDTGDGASEYTLNTLEPGYMGWLYGYGYHIQNRASIAWLTKQQGYKKGDLSSALHCIEENGHDHELQGYIKSAAYEVCNELTSRNQLVFLLELTLEQIMLLFTCAQWGRQTGNWPGYVVLDKETRAGFFDAGSGSGSRMGIRPERDVKLPIKYISSVYPDDLEEGCSVLRVYEDRSMWKGGGLKRMVLPKKLRGDLEKIFLNIEKDNQM